MMAARLPGLRWALGALLAAWLAPATLGCSGGKDPSRLDRAREFRSLLEGGDHGDARALMADDPRRWWESREGPGQPWRIGPADKGPWATWDEQFRSEKEVVEWRNEAGAATAIVRETNDYFRLLERGWIVSEVTYFFDDAGRISGLLIRAVGDRPPGRTADFVAWAAEHEPRELATLMPEGEIDPSGDHPGRFRELLNRWRRESGLDPIE